jgi:hypothetical protein
MHIAAFANIYAAYLAFLSFDQTRTRRLARVWDTLGIGVAIHTSCIGLPHLAALAHLELSGVGG